MDYGKIAELAQAIGVPGAAVLIIAAGIAWKIDKILTIFREMLNDRRKHALKILELNSRIGRDVERHRVELDQLRRALPPPSGGSK